MSAYPYKPRRILIVDDDPIMRETLRVYLSAAGLEVKTAEHGHAMNRLIMRERFDLMILDLQMPGEDGLSICRRIRRGGDKTPIIMVTGKSEETDRIVGLELGADDYLNKPFNPRELLARIEAVLRRVPQEEHPAAPLDKAAPICFGPFSLNLNTRTLYKHGEPVNLTTGEFSLLKAFVRHPKQPLSRDKLAQLAQGRDHQAYDRSLDVQVSRLRRLIEPDASSPRHIQTVWGVGYVFVPEG
jgi:two-component system, OmpR family, phosphate regulon response regulator OmpR